MKFTKGFYCYGKCESCKNCKAKGFLLYCIKDNRLKMWHNKCYLYKVKRSLV